MKLELAPVPSMMSTFLTPGSTARAPVPTSACARRRSKTHWRSSTAEPTRRPSAPAASRALAASAAAMPSDMSRC